MRRSEKAWLGVGVLLGLLIAGGAYLYFGTARATDDAGAHRPPLQQEAQPSEEPATDEPVAVQLTEDEQKSIGIETAVVQRRTIRKEITSPGKVAEPETGIGTISARIGGRIDRLFTKVTGETISRGDPVALIYSPEVFTAGEEYKLALENRQRLEASRESQAITDANELVNASRRRLELWGLTAEQIDELASSGGRPVQITTYAGISGVVTKRNVAEGQYVKEGDVLLEVTDLSTVWVQADIFESDIPLVRIGQAVNITAPGVPAGALQGTIGFLQPSVDVQTRTMSVRIQVMNPQMRLRPGMFVQVSFQTRLADGVVAVPRSAVLDTGKEKVVYVAKEEGVFEKRTIETSATSDNYYAVAKGIAPGERVVTHGNFLIDSQTRLSGNMTGLFGGSKAFNTDAAVATPQANYSITVRSEPSPPKGASESTFHVTVTGPDGKPVTDAQVKAMLVMPAMPAMGMGEMRLSVDLAWNGSEYMGRETIAMAGPWTVTVEARRGGQLLAVYRARLDAK